MSIFYQWKYFSVDLNAELYQHTIQKSTNYPLKRKIK